uniref:Uncharacterized protein n=1 Tax=Aegilops tauschii subsp. strangulata TaxID=200361 RepID=A0A453F6L0_AEGTS
AHYTVKISGCPDHAALSLTLQSMLSHSHCLKLDNMSFITKDSNVEVTCNSMLCEVHLFTQLKKKSVSSLVFPDLLSAYSTKCSCPPIFLCICRQ